MEISERRTLNDSQVVWDLRANDFDLLLLESDSRDYDVLDFLVDNAARWFSTPGPQHTQYIALCGKFDGNGLGGCPAGGCPWGSVDPCSSTPTVKNWASLMDAFVSDATALVAQHRLNVEFILDGAFGGDQLCGCHKARWLPLKGARPRDQLWAFPRQQRGINACSRRDLRQPAQLGLRRGLPLERLCHGPLLPRQLSRQSTQAPPSE